MAGRSFSSLSKKIDVDQNLPLRNYFRRAKNLLRQAEIYRKEGNQPELFRTLLKYSSLIVEVIPYHHEYKTGKFRQELDLLKKNPDIKKIFDEVDALKPIVKKLQEKEESGATIPSTTSELEYGSWPAYAFDGTADYLFEGDGAIFSSNKTWSRDNNPPGLQSEPMDLLTGQMSAFQLAPAPNPLPSIDSSIPRASKETLMKHSILGSLSRSAPQRRSIQLKAEYPTNLIDITPILLPSFDAPKSEEQAKPEAEEPAVAEPAAAGEPDAPETRLVRQPDPPPIETPIATLALPPTQQIAPADVADPRPGPPGIKKRKGPQPIHISVGMMKEFMRLVQGNTSNNLETCGVLAGTLTKGKFFISALILPKQKATSDSCQTTNEEEIFDAIDTRGLFQLGWIHTHPTQSCFMSSVDLHTHYSYQIMSQEAIAIVMAPTDRKKNFGIFRLSDPGGVSVIQNCQERGFHPHAAPRDGSPIYEHCSHAFLNPNIKFEFIDLR